MIKLNLWSRADLAYIHQTAVALCDEFLSSTSIHTPFDEFWDSFKSICMKFLDLVPTNQVSTNSKQEWINCNLPRNKDITIKLVFPNYRVSGIHIN